MAERRSAGVKLLQRKSARGDAEATFNLAQRVRDGDGIAHDPVEARRLLTLAAEQGSAEAQCRVGIALHQGLGSVVRNDTEAARWYRMAADQGNEVAQCHLGWCYEHGEGVPQDMAEAVRWYRLAAEQGFAGAQFNMGMCCEKAEGVPHDVPEAARWYRLAADADWPSASYQLGRLKLLGEGGVERDVEEGARLLRRAHELDSTLDPAKTLIADFAGDHEVVSKCCMVCANAGSGLKKCERCHVAVFCSHDHLRRAWRAHKPYCNSDEWKAGPGTT